MGQFSHADWQVRTTVSAARRDLYDVTPGAERLIASLVAAEDVSMERFEDAMGLLQAAPIMHATIELALKVLARPEYEDDATLARVIDVLRGAIRHSDEPRTR